LYNHLGLPVDRQQLGPTSPLEPFQVGLYVSAKTCEGPNVLCPDHGCCLDRDPITSDLLRITCEEFTAAMPPRLLAESTVAMAGLQPESIGASAPLRQIEKLILAMVDLRYESHLFRHSRTRKSIYLVFRPSTIAWACPSI
jgi:hypothetical protein